MLDPHIARVIGPVRSVPYARRWLLFAGVPLLLLTILLFSVQRWPAAQAATSVNVGNCSGGTIYATIQGAVNAAVTGTIINICPGTYSESVNLSAMASVGDLTLRAAPGQAGIVTIAPLVGSSLWISPDQIFEGSIILENLHLTSGGDSGINFGGEICQNQSCTGDGLVGGNVTLSGVVANANEQDGAHIDALGNLSVNNSQFNDNAFTGLFVSIAQNVAITNSEANNNGTRAEIGVDGTGIDIYTGQLTLCDVGDDYRVTIDTVTAANNAGWGILIDAALGIFVNNTEVIGNGYDGLLASSGGCFPSSGIIEVTDSLAEYNGLDYNPTTAETGTPESNTTEIGTMAFYEAGGFRLLGEIAVSVSNGTESNRNAGFGYCIYSLGEVVVSDVLAEENLGEGFNYTLGCVVAGIRSAGTGDEASAESESADFGAQLLGLPSIVISASSAISNGGIGFSIYSLFTPVTLTQVSATENLIGVAFAEEESVFIGVGTEDNGTEDNGTEDNGTEDNGTEDIGVQLTPPLGDTWIDNSLIQGNELQGIYYGQPILTTVGPGGPGASHSAPSIAQVIPFTSTNTVNHSIICENGTGLAANQYELLLGIGSIGQQAAPPESYALLVDGRGNWWGDATGPSGLGGGQGDSIESTLLFAPTNTVSVQFDPWISLIEPSISPNPAIAGQPVSVEYRFRDGASTYFLENGVGDPNNGPLFTLATNNGVINGDANKFIADSLISGSVTPSSPGKMTVELSGPCALNSSQDVDVVAAFSLEKTVFVDGYRELIGPNTFSPSDCALASNITVPTGTTVKYCYTLTNTGNYTLSVHSLVDSHVSGPILSNFPREVGPGESFSTVDADVEVTKTLTVSTTNIATWTAQLASPIVTLGALATDALIPVSIDAQATVTISPPDLDQDGDGVPDQVEGSVDINGNLIPDFLDPATPTNAPPVEQPNQQLDLFLPSLGNNR